MTRTLPTSIRDTTQDLEAEPLVRLYKITLATGPVFYLSPNKTETWQGNTWDAIPCTMTELSMESDGKMNRPKFTFVNPQGIFTASIGTGAMENGTVTRYRVLRSDLDANNATYLSEVYRISRIVNLSKSQVVLELRDVLDGHQFILPARAYYPPEFPHVSLR